MGEELGLREILLRSMPSRCTTRKEFELGMQPWVWGGALEAHDAWYKTQCGVSSRLGVQHGEAMSAGIMDSERVLERDLQSKGPTSMLFSEGAT
eukprot:scaffold106436_cov36-Tisochrysis_lutea.AAC.1